MINLATQVRSEKMGETQRFHHITQSVLGEKGGVGYTPSISRVSKAFLGHFLS